MKKQNTHPTQALPLVSYTRKLTCFSSKFHRSIFLLLFALLVTQVSFAQSPFTINAASANDDIAVPGYFFSAGNIETSVCTCTSSSTGHLIAFVTDGDGSVYSSFTPEWKAGLTVTDDNGHFDFYGFDAVTYSVGSPTSFRKPDVVLLEDGKKAIITFETNDATYKSYVLELDISVTSNSVTINLPSGGLADPINISTPSYSPRIDGDFAEDRFAIVSIQGNVPIYSIYHLNNFGFYVPYSLIDNIPANSITITNTIMMPDIALGHFTGNGAPYPPECVVSYIHGDFTGNGTSDLIVDYQDYQQLIIPQLGLSSIGSGSTTLFTALSTYPNYPHICSEEAFSNSGLMKWALAESLVDPAIATGSGQFLMHMLYVNSDYFYVNPSVGMFYLDDANMTTDPDLQGKGTLDWMNQDGFVACRYEIASPNTQEIVGVMEPYISGYGTWDQVYDNYNVAPVTGSDRLQALSVASDAASGLYVVAEIWIGKVIYKVRNILSTGFKPSDLSATHNNTYPNPCMNSLNITSNANDEIYISDILGRVVLSTSLVKGHNIINTSTLLSGNYILHSNHNSILNTLFSVVR